MIRRFLLTFGSRLGQALLNFAVVLLTARFLGAAGRGHVSLLSTDYSLLLLFIGLVGGAPLIFLAPRRRVGALLVPAVAWATVVCGGGAAAVWLLRAVPVTYALHVGALALVQAYFSIVVGLLLGRRHEHWFNALNLLQSVLLVGVLGVAFGGLGWRRVEVFYLGQYVSFGVVLVLAAGLLLRQPDHRGRAGGGRWRGWQRTARELARQGRSAQFSNIVVFFNYRLGYYFLAHYGGLARVGVLSVGVALAEALWLIGRSAAQTQYVDLIHAPDRAARLPALLRTTRLTALLTAAGLGALLALPPAWLAAIFGASFGAARPIIAVLAPGVLAVGTGMVPGTWFSGQGRYRPANVAAVAGLLVNVPACWWLVPHYGALGAAAASSLAYLTSTAVLLRFFCRHTGTPLRALLPWPIG